MAEKGSHTVLVVDDDPGHRGMLEALLGRWGLAVTSAGDGKEAVARVCERPFDVVRWLTECPTWTASRL